MRRKQLRIDNLWFQQDCAPPAGLDMRYFGNVNWPSVHRRLIVRVINSGFLFMGFSEGKCVRKPTEKFESVEKLSIRHEIERIPHQTIVAAFQNIRTRENECIRMNGGHLVDTVLIMKYVINYC